MGANDLDGRVLFPRPLVMGESLRQHLHRVGHACVYEVERWWRDLIPPGARSPDRLQTKEHVHALATVIGRTPREVMDMTLHRFARAYYPPDALGDLPVLPVDDGLPIPLWRLEDMAAYAHGAHVRAVNKVCPLCRGPRRTILLPWALRQVTTCPIHLVRLVGRCQGCGSLLRMDPETGACRECGRDTATFEAETIATDPDSVTLTAAVWGALGFEVIAGSCARPAGNEEHPLSRMPPRALLAYLWVCGPLLARRDPGNPLYADSPMGMRTFRAADIGVAHDLLLGAWRLLNDWPHRLEASLVRIAAHESAHQLRRFAFPRMLFAHFPPSNPSFAWLHEAFADFMHTHLGLSPGVTAWYPTYRDVVAKIGPTRSSLMNKKEAAASLGIGYTRFKRYINAGVIEVRDTAGDGHRPACLIDSREVERLARVRGTPLTVEDAARYLGVGRDMVAALTDAGLIRVAQLRAADGRTTIIYRAELLDHSLVDLLRPLPVRPVPVGPGYQIVRLRGVQALLRGQGGRLPELLRAVRDGLLATFRATGKSFDLSDLWWEKRAVSHYLQSRLPDENNAYLTEQDVALFFRVAPGILHRWRDAGLLLPMEVLGGERDMPNEPQARSTYDRSAVDAFRERYALLREAAAFVGVVPATLQRWADSGRVPGARVYYVPNHEGALYDRRSLADFKTAHVTANEAASLLGIQPRAFNKLVRLGRIEVATVGIARSRLYDRAEVLRLKAPPRRVHGFLLDEFVLAKNAARYLGISHRSFNRLVARGVIRPAMNGGRKNRKYRQVDVSELARKIGLVTDDVPASG